MEEKVVVVVVGEAGRETIRVTNKIYEFHKVHLLITANVQICRVAEILT